jgi:CheY-like chemotaxis protein
MPVFEPPSGGSGEVAGEEEPTARRLRRSALIADDDSVIRDSRAWCLRAAGWRVEEASTGQEAMFVATTVLPDVMVIELHLPGIDGFEVTKLLKGESFTQDIAVVAYSRQDALQRAQDEILATQAGCDKFLPALGSPEELRELLENLVLRRRYGPSMR